MKNWIHLIDSVMVGGESGEEARILDFEWVKDVRKQCLEAGVSFSFHQTGARILVNGRLYEIPRNRQHSQAEKAFRGQ